jgi:aspartyl-tRNA(Asn)/glutamyl-tRNA(Gln) amidotransferase subunit B
MYIHHAHTCMVLQITQQRLPIAQDGILKFDVIDKQGQFQYKAQVRIERIQIEQDSGKSLHNISEEYTLVDLNRAGMGLLEVVFAPDLKTSLEASSCLRAVQKLFRHIGVCDGNMQDGSMRCDVNVSVREHRDVLPIKSVRADNKDKDADDGSSLLQGNRVEVKNINSIQSVNAAANFEINRHISILESDDTFGQETRGYDDASQTTFTMRAKETAVDYRIFPDPDIPVLTITEEDITAAMGSAEGAGRVELPEVTLANMVNTYELELGQAESLLAHPGASAYFEDVYALKEKDGSQSKISGGEIYNWMTGDLLGNLNNNFFNFLNAPIDPSQLHTILVQVASNQISALQAKQVIKCLFETEFLGMDPVALIEKKGWKQISDDSAITRLIEEAISDPKNTKKLETYQSVSSKRDRMTSFFFGEVMKKSKGQASPQAVKHLLAEALLKTLDTTS